MVSPHANFNFKKLIVRSTSMSEYNEIKQLIRKRIETSRIFDKWQKCRKNPIFFIMSHISSLSNYTRKKHKHTHTRNELESEARLLTTSQNNPILDKWKVRSKPLFTCIPCSPTKSILYPKTFVKFSFSFVFRTELVEKNAKYLQLAFRVEWSALFCCLGT